MLPRTSTLAAIAIAALGFTPSSEGFFISGGASIARLSATRGVTSLARSPTTSTSMASASLLGVPLLRSNKMARKSFALRMAEDETTEASEEPTEATEEPAEEDPFAGLDLNSKEFLQRKVEILEKELADAQADTASLQDLVARNILKKATAAELKDTYIRLAADFENFRRRSSIDLGNAKNMALTSVLKDMVTVLDNFELASKNVATSTEKEESIKKSYDALGTQLTNTLTKLGVEAIDPLGLDFDPMFHDGIQQAESTEYAEGKVCKALQRGYKVGNQTIRPAIVVVSAGPGPAGGSSEAAAPSEE